MYGIPKRCKPLSAAEEQVLLAVWDNPAPVTRREVSRRLAGHGWTEGTVLTFLTRLEAKGWLSAAKESNHKRQHPHRHPAGLRGGLHAPAVWTPCSAATWPPRCRPWSASAGPPRPAGPGGPP